MKLTYRFGFNFLHLNKFFPIECLLTSSNFYQLVLFWIGPINPCKSTKRQEGPGMKDGKGSWPWCFATRRPGIRTEGALGRRMVEGRNAIQRTAAGWLSPHRTAPSAEPWFPARSKDAVQAAFTAFSHSKSTEDKRLLCWKPVLHGVTTGLNVLKNTLLLFISITANAKRLPDLLGGTRVSIV